MNVSDRDMLVQKVIQKIVDMPAEKVTKILIFMAGMDAEQTIDTMEKKELVV